MDVLALANCPASMCGVRVSRLADDGPVIDTHSCSRAEGVGSSTLSVATRRRSSGRSRSRCSR